MLLDKYMHLSDWIFAFLFEKRVWKIPDEKLTAVLLFVGLIAHIDVVGGVGATQVHIGVCCHNVIIGL